ncbi:hypothetical protein [Flavobacterium collinsii]|jgi:hypothetical protein|uniref:DUF3806 domain-containing protein n=1 Tax=Flavobacterium collinsii TaxID=1114861 RepID=A0ABN7EIH2_9FLAO|nr:hypothetical protein [Flavobacterium collinsii]CAA9197860.1 hypothetical protein FLACOL7796_01911 [Flavobacterium collinsii]
MEKYNTLKDEKDFRLFIDNIPSYNLKLQNVLKKERLTYEEEEIRLISRYFIQLVENDSFTIENKKQFIAYLGEAFMQKYGGEWGFTGIKSDSFAINEPVITKYKRESLREAPSEMISAIFEKNDENYFNRSIKYTEEFDKKVDDVFAQLFPKRKKK